MLVAVSDEDPDKRRDAIVRIAKSREHGAEWAIKGYVAIALLETDSQARCVAIRALVRTGDARATETLLKILNHRDYPPADVRPPDALCRWDATAGLADLLIRSQVPEASRAAVRVRLCDRLRQDTDRHVRVAAARGLGFCHDAETVTVLIDGLRDENFAVVYECENSLVRLTGVTHGCDPAEWERWQQAHHDALFASAGAVPESRRPPYSNGFEKVNHQVGQLFQWLWPASKE
jgi:HEAT repeat protein